MAYTITMIQAIPPSFLENFGLIAVLLLLLVVVDMVMIPSVVSVIVATKIVLW